MNLILSLGIRATFLCLYPVDVVFFDVTHDLAVGYGSLQFELGLAGVLIFHTIKLLRQFGFALIYIVSAHSIEISYISHGQCDFTLFLHTIAIDIYNCMSIT